MKKNISAILLTFGILLPSISFSQSIYEILHKAEKDLQVAFPDYHQVELDLLVAKAKDTKDLDVDYLLAIVLLEQSGDEKALKYVKNITDSDEEYVRDFDFFRGFLEHRNQNFTEAEKYYKLFKNKLSKTELSIAQGLSVTNYLITNFKHGYSISVIDIEDLGKTIDNLINQTYSGRKLIKSPKNVNVINLGFDINSNFDEYSPVYSAIDSTLYFTSRRPIPNHLKKVVGDELFIEHIFEADHKEGNWSKARFESEPLNSFTHNVSALAINREGNDIFVFDHRQNGDILHSTKKNDSTWSDPVTFSPMFSTAKVERSFAISDDGKLVILERDGDKPSGRDLYYSNYDGVNWSLPLNMGNVINTEFQEDAVFLHNNGKVLYFSSKGHNSMGGYDVFKSEWKDTAWTKPVNMGYPINTPYDDIYFVISDDESFGFVSSNRQGGNGGFDVYYLNLKPNPLNQEVIVKIIDQENGSYLSDAKVVLTDKTNGNEYPMKRMPDGTYEVMLPNKESHNTFSISVKKTNFTSGKKEFIMLDSLKKYEVGTISLKEIKPEILKFVFNDVYLFDVNSSKFFDKYHDRLSVLINALADHNVTILIEGHTDISGSAKSNMRLSENRANEVRDYLISQGASPDKIIVKGYGDTKPLNDNSTKELRELNRRVTVSLVN